MVFAYLVDMTIGERLRAARKKRKKRQLDIANELGLNQSTVAQWELDEALPRTQIIRAVAKAYGLNPEQLLPEAA